MYSSTSNTNVVSFLSTLPAGTIVNVQFDSVPGTGGAKGTGLILGLKFQGILNGFAQFTNWPGVAPGEIVRISLSRINAVGV